MKENAFQLQRLWSLPAPSTPSGVETLLPLATKQTLVCIANAPGNPVHVLPNDRESEHIPRCNLAFRANLEAIG